MHGAALREVVVRDSRADLASFAEAGLERVTFEDCVLTQADFLDARLRNVRFLRCDLTQADLRGARMTDCELRGCTLDGLEGIEALRGAAMPWADIVGTAGAFAAALGIRVLDEADD